MADMPIRLYRLEVSKGAKLVLSYLWRYAGRERFVWVDRETIASDLGIESDRTLRRHLGELRKAGAIQQDVQVRSGRARPGWWLRDGGDVGRVRDVGRDVGGASTEPAKPGSSSIPEAKTHGATQPNRGATDPSPGGGGGTEATHPSGQKWPPPDKTDRGRTKMAADPAKNGRPISIELPGTKDLSEPTPTFEPTSDAGGGGSGEDRVTAGLARLRRWRVHGRDPERLGPWPTPKTPNGLTLPRLPMGGKLEDLLRQDWAPEQLHQAVHLVAELVERGALPASKWRATYVFSGWLEGLVVTALERRAKQALAEQQGATAPHAGEFVHAGGQEPEISRDGMLMALESSLTLRPSTKALRAPSPKPPRSPPVREDDYIELLGVRSQVQAVAEQLDREPEDVLKALGRSSMRELEVADRTRLARVFVELRGEFAAPDGSAVTHETSDGGVPTTGDHADSGGPSPPLEGSPSGGSGVGLGGMG